MATKTVTSGSIGTGILAAHCRWLEERTGCKVSFYERPSPSGMDKFVKADRDDGVWVDHIVEDGEELASMLKKIEDGLKNYPYKKPNKKIKNKNPDMPSEDMVEFIFKFRKEQEDKCLMNT